jgi:hypothetical protein
MDLAAHRDFCAEYAAMFTPFIPNEILDQPPTRCTATEIGHAAPMMRAIQ